MASQASLYSASQFGASKSEIKSEVYKHRFVYNYVDFLLLLFYGYEQEYVLRICRATGSASGSVGPLFAF